MTMYSPDHPLQPIGRVMSAPAPLSEPKPQPQPTITTYETFDEAAETQAGREPAVYFRCTKAERNLIRRAARLDDKSMRQWCRDILVATAKQRIENV